MALHTVYVVALIGCMLFAGHADALMTLTSTELHPEDGIVYIPKDESLRLHCVTRGYTYPVSDAGSVPSEYSHRLFKKEGDQVILLITSQADGCETVVEHTVTSDNTSATVDYLFTIFRVKEEEAGSITYGCMLVAKDARDSSLLESRENLTIKVCAEPVFNLSMVEGNSQSELDRPVEGNNIVLNATDKCRIKGVLSYFVNGVRVKRGSSGDAPSPQAVERDDGSLAIHSPVCDGRPVCNVTAQFKYISERNFDNSYSHMLLDDCCINDGPQTTPMPTKATVSAMMSQLTPRANTTRGTNVTESIGGDPYAERRQLEIGKLRLEIEVLQLKKELIPLQIIGRENRIKDVKKRQEALEEEEVTSIQV